MFMSLLFFCIQKGAHRYDELLFVVSCRFLIRLQKQVE